jgi:hypothetical protein
MMPDITTSMPSRKGMKVVFLNVFMPVEMIGQGKEWDILARIGRGDECNTTFAISLAFTASENKMVKMFKGHEPESKYRVEGVFGEMEASASGSEQFRRVWCKTSGVSRMS